MESSKPDDDNIQAQLLRQLLGAVERLNSTMVEQKESMKKQAKILEKHTEIFEVLEKDSRKDEQPYETKPWHDTTAWQAMWHSATANTKEQVEEWKSGMDVSLVFIAIFLAVLTAFLVPALQALSLSGSNGPAIVINNATTLIVNGQMPTLSSGPGSDGTSPPPLPPISDQIICMFYESALIVTIFNAVLCVLGRQWVGQLLRLRDASTYLERTMRHEKRKKMITRWLELLVNALHWSLLLSIALFISGLLYQLWAVAFSFVSPAPILVATSALGTLLTFCIALLIVATTAHAVIHSDSPFDGPLSRVVRRYLVTASKTIERYNAAIPSNDQPELAPDFQEDNDLFGDWSDPDTLEKWDERMEARTQAVETFARLISETNEPDLLQRTVPALQFKEWLFPSREKGFEAFPAALSRLNATDTSPRVKATVAQHQLAFGEWIRVITLNAPHRQSMMKSNELLNWLSRNCAVQDLHDPDRSGQLFISYFTFCSFRSPSQRLVGFSYMSVDECIARALLLSNQPPEERLGGVFHVAVNVCHKLLDGKQDSLRRILSYVPPFRVLISALNLNERWWPWLRELVEFVAEGHELEILNEISPFLIVWQRADDFAQDVDRIFNFVEFFWVIMHVLPADMPFPIDVDVSSGLEAIASLEKVTFDVWERYVDPFLLYLERTPVDLVSNRPALLRFLRMLMEKTRPVYDPDDRLNDEMCRRAILYDNHNIPARFIPLPDSEEMLERDTFDSEEIYPQGREVGSASKPGLNEGREGRVSMTADRPASLDVRTVEDPPLQPDWLPLDTIAPIRAVPVLRSLRQILRPRRGQHSGM
ncbi:hypothetical protein SISSUDRAFT_1053328 [Sistotremastrum suecicum HHB10207 ss-3]|uniref:DUF6535 domain-containing protein n=1 Tax=Sistotremastrum suecicum HHB10207 ss-3 TaxID=1314776 RepID=A0A165Z9R7_9AGAM|nr:hypothetical protein SISSUDRAFT_1053328 [Sistotremastrum suecicum HHB10207 ss-3]